MKRHKLGHDQVRGDQVSHVFFLLRDHDTIEMECRYPNLTGAVAVVEIGFYNREHRIDDRHIGGELPPKIKEILGGEYQEGHFEVSLPLGEFFVKASDAGLFFLGVVGEEDLEVCPECGGSIREHLHTDYSGSRDWRCLSEE